jgi:hypothetical protein
MEADNYSWFYLYYWFSKQWPNDWNDGDVNSFTDPATGDYEVANESFPVDEDAIDTDKNMPNGCRGLGTKDLHGNEQIQCDYTGSPLISKGGCILS